MGVIADTSIFVAIERGRLDLDAIIGSRGDEGWYVTSLTVSELYQGVETSASYQQREQRRAYVEQLLEDMTVLNFDMAAAQTHARLAAQLRAAGTPVGAVDLLIAAIAVHHDFELVTLDAKSFPRIAGLRYAIYPAP